MPPKAAKPSSLKGKERASEPSTSPEAGASDKPTDPSTNSGLYPDLGRHSDPEGSRSNLRSQSKTIRSETPTMDSLLELLAQQREENARQREQNDLVQQTLLEMQKGQPTIEKLVPTNRQSTRKQARAAKKAASRAPSADSSDHSDSPDGSSGAEGSSPIRRRSRRRGKVYRPDKVEPLEDNVNPTYRDWVIDIQDRFDEFEEYFDGDESSKMRFIYKSTAGEAKTLLRDQYEPDAEDPFVTAQEMLDCLRNNFVHPYEAEVALLEFQKLCWKDHYDFVWFRKEFRRLASLAKVPKVSWLRDLKLKLPKRLLDHVELPAFQGKVTDFEEYCQLVLVQDQVHQNSLQRSRSQPVVRTTVTPKARSTGNAGRVQFAIPTVPVPARPSSTFVRGASSNSIPPRQGSAPYQPRERAPTPHDSDTCHTCGQKGHWAKDCPSKSSVNEVGPVEELAETEAEQDAEMEGVPVEAFSGYVEQLSENDSA